MSKVSVEVGQTVQRGATIGLMVSPEEANLQDGKIAVTSPVGQAIMGSGLGEVVAAKVPAGLIKFEILKIE